MTDYEGQRSATAAKLRWLLVVGLLVANLLLFAMGSVAAIRGGELSDWGSGAGGLGGWPNEFMTYFSFVIGLAAGIATFRERRTILVAVGVFATGLIISTVFLDVAHLVDPCARNWWDFSTTVGDTRMCSPQGEVAVRFHLLLHGAFGALAAGMAAVIYRRKNLFDWWPPAARLEG
ncbi:MAG: hypothetical protein OEZ14_12830 [Acidimicrobiia bacterium]|nr:hypothetical protein [Acidimicrobiia bacterium]